MYGYFALQTILIASQFQLQQAANLLEYYKNRTTKQRDLIERATKEIALLNGLKE